MSEAAGPVRLDKFLWQARFFKTRSLASALVTAGRVRINGQRTLRPAHPVRVGDGLTFPQGKAIRVIRVTALPQRRGPAVEAQGLYRDVDETVAPTS